MVSTETRRRIAAGDMRIALCHEWLTTFGGSEQVAQRIASVLGIEDVYAFTVNPQTAAELFPDARVRAAHRIGSSSLARTHWQWFLPVMPYAWAKLDLSGYDAVVTSSHSCVNAIRVSPDTPIVSYCHTPMRYAWQWREEIARFPALTRPAWPAVAGRFRAADRRWAQRVSLFIANSQNVAARIKSFYGRDAVVVHPPVDTDFWTPDPTVPKEDFFLYAGRLVAYKRPDVAIRAANQLRAPLVVAGAGPELERLKMIAGSNVEFVVSPTNEELRDLYRRARAFVFPGVEDFGMTLVEAQACGTPVIAYNRGGSQEAILDGHTGLLYEDPSPHGLATAIQGFDVSRYPIETLRTHAERFSVVRFDHSFKQAIAEVCGIPGDGVPPQREAMDLPVR